MFLSSYREEVSFVKKIDFTLWHRNRFVLNSFQIEDDLLD
jgi:hypothetical protein